MDKDQVVTEVVDDATTDGEGHLELTLNGRFGLDVLRVDPDTEKTHVRLTEVRSQIGM